MATRKAITLVSGLFQEVNTPTDKLDFAGNTTADLGENTNLYYTDARSRAAVSVTDSGGLGSLAYNSSTGVITYTGPSNSDVRGTLSVASGEGLTYDASTGEFGTNAIPNSQLANSGVTIGSTSVSLGSTVTNFAGLGQLVMSNLYVGAIDAASTINIQSGQIIFEGSTADANETILSAADATGGDKALVLPNESGTLLSTGSSIANSNLANSTITFGSDAVALGSTVTGISLTNIQAITKLQVGSQGGAGNIVLHADNSGGFSRGITFEGASGGVDANETLLAVTDPTADRTITLPDATGTVALLSTLSIASGSGLTYNSSTGEFGTNAIPNSQLANSSITIGGTGVALGGSITTFSGLSSVTADAVVTKTGGFRVIDSTDNTKQVAFDASAVSGSTTRTLAVPDASDTLTLLAATQTLTNKTLTSAVLNGTISGTSIKDEDNMSSDSASHLATQQSIKAYVDTEIAGVPQGDITAVTAGTGLSGGGTTGAVSLAIDATVATLTGSQTLTNKTIVLGNNTVSGALANGITATTQSASDNSTKVATTAYVDNQVTAGAVNEFADNVFRVKDNSDTSKKLAFECSGISGSTTRTMTVPNTDGTISTESFATAIAVALG